MNSMFEIYKNQADIYDELVGHEDFNHNLAKFIHEKTDMKNKTICEFGVGTGRLTKTYVDLVSNVYAFDNSEHMVRKAKQNLIKYSDKVKFEILDNREIQKLDKSYDYIVEGWSFGHLISEEVDYMYWIDKLVNDCKKIAANILIIETMGTLVSDPKPPTEKLEKFYSELRRNGFIEKIIRTDYRFESVDQAKYIIGAFFGKGMEEKIKEVVVKEYTGIWMWSR